MPILAAHSHHGNLSPHNIDGIHSLHYQTFRERLRRDIPTIDERERDRNDDLHPVIVIVRDEQQVLACGRLFSTTGLYMLKDTFPELLAGRVAPVVDEVWEISRFAVTKEARAGLGFTVLPAALIRETASFLQKAA